MIGDGRAHAHQGVQEWTERARVGLLIPVEECFLGGQRRQGRQEAHDGAGQAALDAPAARRKLHRSDAQCSRALVLHARAHDLQGGREQARVARIQGTANDGGKISDGSQVEGARRDRL